MGLYPCSQISEDADKSVFEAARTSLIARGDGHGTGWSLGHKINLNARAYEGLHCHNLIKRALQQTWDTGTNEAARGIYENLWDAHAPYQIDGNFGYTAGVAEMLLQSYNDKLVILPALPTSFWQKGSVKGLKAVGNFTVDIDWDNAKATQIRVVSNEGIPCVVKYTGIAKDYKVTTADGKSVETKRISDDEISSKPLLEASISSSQQLLTLSPLSQVAKKVPSLPYAITVSTVQRPTAHPLMGSTSSR